MRDPFSSHYIYDADASGQISKPSPVDMTGKNVEARRVSY